LPDQLSKEIRIKTRVIKKLPISISETAIDKINQIKMEKKIGKEYYLRLGVKSAGCGVGSYVIGFDHKNEKDELFEIDNLQIIIEKIQVMYLAGKIVDFGESEGRLGFIFRETS